MELGHRLVKLRTERGLTQEQLAEMLNMSRSTYAQYEVNRRTPDAEMITILANFFNVSTDYLLGRSNTPANELHSQPLTPKDERDISKDLEKILSNLESDEALAFDGEPIDDETRELMRISLENSMRIAKQLAKKKFTPKKYK